MYSIIKGTYNNRYRFNTANYISNKKKVFTVQQLRRVQMTIPVPVPTQQNKVLAKDNVMNEKKEEIVVRKLITIKGESNNIKKTPNPPTIELKPELKRIKKGTSSNLIRIK